MQGSPDMTREKVDSSDGGFWEDVTSCFLDARDEMEVGEMIHRDTFNLHAAMSAIELMDPKMDIGFGDVRNAGEVALPSNLNDSQVINIMDELLACEMSWLDAHTLPQTVFACVYTQRMYEIPRFELFSFIRVQLATMDSILNLILDEKVADDEDFVASTYGFNLRPLCSGPPEEDHVILQKILERIENRSVEETESAKSKAAAINLRVRVQVEFYRTVQCLSGFSFEHSLQEAPQLILRLQEQVSLLRSCPYRGEVDHDFIQRIFDQSINRHLMTSSPPRTAPLFDLGSGLEYFERILSEWSELVKLEALSLPWDARKTTRPGSRKCSLQAAMHCISYFSAQLNPTAVTRSLMSRIMVPEYASALFTQEDADFRRLVATDMGIAEEIMTTDMMNTLAALRGGTVDIFKCFCRNRSRQRRQILRLLRWWDHYAFLAAPKSEDGGDRSDIGKETTTASNIVADQEKANGDAGDVHRPSLIARPNLTRNAVEAVFAAKTPLQIVAYELTARMMVHHWLLGFECNLYKEYEYAAVFFYVGYVLTTMANATTSLAEKGIEGGSLHPLRFALYIMDEARLWMCRALHSALEALSREKQWKYSCGRPNLRSDPGDGMFGSEKLWYEQRFGVVRGMVNGPLYADYDSFLSFKTVHEESLLARAGGLSITLLLLRDAANGFLVARRTLERARKAAQLCSANKLSEEILQIARVAVENSLIVSQLTQSFQPSPEEKREVVYDVNFKFVRHRHFPVIEVKSL